MLMYCLQLTYMYDKIQKTVLHIFSNINKLVYKPSKQLFRIGVFLPSEYFNRADVILE